VSDAIGARSQTGGHPLGRILHAAALGSPPPSDGEVEILPPLEGPVDAVCSFTAHSVIAIDLPRDRILSHLDPDDLGSPMSAPFLTWVEGSTRTKVGVLDAVLVAPDPPARASVDLVERADLIDHPRVARAGMYRSQIRVFADPTGAGVLVIGRGLAGRWEMSFEVNEPARGSGLGRLLAAAAPSVVGDEPLFAQCSPGNAGSLRALIAAGYAPIGSECLFLRPAER
jgi:hypothetical protein